MRKYLLTALMTVRCMLSWGQGDLPVNTSLEKNLFIANIITPSLSSEIRLSDKTSLAMKAGFDLGVIYDDYDGGKINVGFWPYVMADYRYYYNLNKRAIKNHGTLHNSGNFIALSIQFRDHIPTPLTIEKDYVWSAGPVWGIQRTYWNRINMKIALGMGVSKRENQHLIPWPIIDYSLGVRLGK